MTLHICTKEDPWSREKADRSEHPDAVGAGECSEGCCDYWFCPNCKLTFRTEVAQ